MKLAPGTLRFSLIATVDPMTQPTQIHSARTTVLFLAALVAICSVTTHSAYASSKSKEATFASGPGTVIYLAAALGLPTLLHKDDASSSAIRTVDALGTSFAITEGLKSITHEKRPDSNSHDSFPSEHATAAFAAATVVSRFYPDQAPFWYIGATAIAASRLQLNKHHVQDVLVGAAIGYGTAQLELAQPRGLILAPFITPGEYGLEVGLRL